MLSFRRTLSYESRLQYAVDDHDQRRPPLVEAEPPRRVTIYYITPDYILPCSLLLWIF